MAVTKLVLMRHGQSLGNQANLFTGWYDLDLSDKGHEEAKKAGQLMRTHGLHFKGSHSSMLRRAIHTLWHCLDELDQTWLCETKSWRLNERHYGALQGLDKAETFAKYGREQVQQWRRGFNVTPPAVTQDSPHFPGHDRRYKNIPAADLPCAESLAETIKRVLPYWWEMLLPRLQAGENQLVVTHGTVIRALVSHLDHLSQEATQQLEIPTGTPIVYELDKTGSALRHYYLDQAP